MPRAERLLACLVAGLALVHGEARAGSGPPGCSPTAQNIYVRDVMHDLYLWHDEVGWPNPSRYPAPDVYLEALRVRPRDAAFSFVTSRAADEAFFGASQFVGFGFSLLEDRAGRLRVSDVYPDSPAAEAGMARGDRLVSVDGVAVGRLIDEGALDAALGPARPGVARTFTWRPAPGGHREAALVKRLVTIPTVSRTRVVSVAGRRVGYLFFRNFVAPSFAALDEAFGELAGAGIDELVVDLRYNGGGLVSVARRLASLVGGAPTDGQIFARLVHNDRYRFRDETVRFERTARALDLQRLIVITTPQSASASELLINALLPFMPVVVVGDRTFGKPVGQYGLSMCEHVFHPVAFSVVNADGEGDFFDGIPADCPVPDDLDHALGDPAEASLAEALHVARTGRCSPASRARAASGRAARGTAATAAASGPARDGWRRLLNAW